MSLRSNKKSSRRHRYQCISNCHAKSCRLKVPSSFPDSPNKTSLLPPLTAVRHVWARTGTFSCNDLSKQRATVVESALKDIKNRALGSQLADREYVLAALATMDASYRSLEIVHKKRDLDFKDNQKLRELYLESIKETQEFGTKAKDIIKTVPAMAIGGSVGGIVASNYFLDFKVSLEPWFMSLVATGAGYLVHLLFVRLARMRKQRLFIFQDYERSLYYDQFISQVALILESLYTDMNSLHDSFFGKSYSVKELDPKMTIENLLRGSRSTFCKHIHKHMMEKKITSELWPLCETGIADEKMDEKVKTCLHWENEKLSFIGKIKNTIYRKYLS